MSKNVFKLSLRDLENLGEPIDIDDVILKLGDEEFKRLDPESKEVLLREEVRHAIRTYGSDGLSTDEIVQLTGRDKKTIQKHLNALIGLREVYSQKKNKKLTLFYPNGKPIHGFSKKRLDMGNTFFEISIAEGPKNKHFYHVLEKRVSILDGDKAEGAILISLDKVDDFINCLNELKTEVGSMIYE